LNKNSPPARSRAVFSEMVDREIVIAREVKGFVSSGKALARIPPPFPFVAWLSWTTVSFTVSDAKSRTPPPLPFVARRSRPLPEAMRRRRLFR
jgi:hypothetical protein